jgi:hypothetical protein
VEFVGHLPRVDLGLRIGTNHCAYINFKRFHWNRINLGEKEWTVMVCTTTSKERDIT